MCFNQILTKLALESSIQINLKVPWGLGIKTCFFFFFKVSIDWLATAMIRTIAKLMVPKRHIFGMNAAIVSRILQHLCFTAMNDKYFREPHLHLEVRSAGSNANEILRLTW